MKARKGNKPLGAWVDHMIEYYGSQRALAKAANVKEPSVSDWARGKTKPGLRSLLRIERDSKKRFKAREVRPELF